MAEPARWPTFDPMDPYAGVDPDTARKLAGTVLPSIASAAVANIAPDPSLPGALGYIPFTGAAEGAASTLGLLYNLGRTGVNKLFGGYGVNLPPPPAVAEKAGEHLGATQEQIFQQLPHYQPTPEEAPDYELAKGFSSIIGSAVPVAPGAAITSLPRFVRGGARFLLPTTEGAAANMAIAGTAGPGLAAALMPQDAQAAPAQQAQPPPTQPQPDDIGVQFGNINSPFSQASQTQTVSSNAPATLDFSNVNLGGGSSPTAPTFHEEGSSPISGWQAAAGIGISVAALLAGRYLHGMGGAISDVGRDTRMADPDYAAKVQDYQNEQAAVQSGTQISNAQGERTPAPLPQGTPVHEAAVAAQTATLDATAAARDYINKTATDPDAATRLGNMYGLGMDQSRWQSVSREFYTTGIDDSSKIKVPSPKALFDDIGDLSIPDRKVLNDGLHAANEMDNRNYNYGRGNVTDAAHDFAAVPDQTLVGLTQQMLADPRLAGIAQRYWGIGSGLIDIGEARGFFSPEEAARMKAIRPNYVPEVGLDGTVTHALGPRNMAGVAGIDQVNTTAWSAMAQHIEELTRQMDINEKIVQPFTQHQLDVQQQAPQSAQFLKEVANPNAGNAPSLYPTLGASGSSYREPIYSMRDGTGTRFFRSDSPEFYNFIKGQNSNKTLMNLGIFDRARRAVQIGTTGILSMATGRAFPLTHLARVSMTMQSNRPRGMVGSLSDVAMQRATGGRVGQRLVYDPTNIPGIAYSFARGQYDKFIRDLAGAIHPDSPHPDAQLLRTLVGDSQMRSISDRLMNYYLGTTTHEMAATGATGAGMPFRFRVPAGALGGQELKDIRLQAAQLSPKLFMSGGKLGSIRPFFINLRSALEEPFSDLMDAGNQYFYRLNKTFNPNVDPARLAYETRALVGNPSTKGASAAVRAYTQLEEYSNIAAQAMARRGRSLNETPITSSASIVGQLGTIAALSMFTAMRNPQTMQYFENMVTTQARAANAILFGNEDPQYHTEISLPQEVRWLYPMILDVLSKGLNTAAAVHDPSSYDGLMQFFKDMFSEHIENSTLESSLHGLGDAASFIDVPSIVNGLMAVGGKSLRINVERMVNDALNGQFGWNTFSMDLGKDDPLPNHPVGDHLFEGQDGKILPAVMSNLLGTFGTLLDDGMGLVRNAHHMDSFLSALGQSGKDWVQKAMDLNPELNNLLWENPARESMRSPIVEMTERRLSNMKLAGGARNAEMMEATTGGKNPLPITPQPADSKAVPTDPAMRNLFFTVQAEHNWIQSHFVSQINQIKKQMQDATNQPMDNTQRRQWMNNQTRVISDKYRYINSVIEDKNAQLSNMYQRRIDIGAPIDWKGDVSQFAPLN